MRRLTLGISLTALTTLLLELVLARVFDVILIPNMAYVVITCAVFAYGLAGLYAAVRPRPARDDDRLLPKLAALTGLATVLLLPIINLLPFDFEAISDAPFRQLVAFGLVYLALVVPFFLSGLILTTVFGHYPRDIQRLYCWDLVGAAVGCAMVVPLLPRTGPGGLLFIAASLCLVASAAFASERGWALGALGAAAALLLVPMLVPSSRLDFRQHTDKRGMKAAESEGKIQFTRWDPVSRIDVHPMEVRLATDVVSNAGWHIAYDGGIQSSYFYRFDGDFAALRARIEENAPYAVRRDFWQRGVLASHRLRRDTGSKVLIFGSAGGQETKAALMYGASQVDAVELVGTVVELGTKQYADSIGRIFNDPRVRAHVAEGRSFLRASDRKFDIIQIFSNYTPRSMTQGIGALQPAYLQTADAYREYFTHLTPEGILHVNHQIVPRMVTTAALAWRQLGRTDFRRHVVVFEPERFRLHLPTMLIRLRPWTQAEVDELNAFFNSDSTEGRFQLVVNPLGPEHNVLPDDFFSGQLPNALVRGMAYRVTPVTDDRPFFYLIRKRFERLQPDSATFLPPYIADLLNRQLKRGWLPMDMLHLFLTGLASVLFMALAFAVPFRFAGIGRAAWHGKLPTLGYFACLGAGFIVLELVLIQLFIRLVGYPLYAYSVVIFVLLLAAGLGSFASEKLGVTLERRWTWPFVGVLAVGTLLLVVHAPVFQLFLAEPLGVRVTVAAVLIFPLGFFLGMPFPLGILAAARLPHGAVAWAWALNGVFTVAGGLLTAILSLFLGFATTIKVALGIYALAFALMAVVRRAVSGLQARGSRLPDRAAA
jgi:spermidine synthase